MTEQFSMQTTVLDSKQLQSLLRIYTFYRTFLTFALLVVHWSSLELQLGSIDDKLYLYTLWAYFVINCLTLLSNWLRPQWTNSQTLFFSLLIDIVAINLLTHASGGIDSGLAAMAIVTVAAGSLMFKGQWATLIAAFAAIATLAEQIIAAEKGTGNSGIVAAGLLGASLFISSLLVQFLASRARDSQILAEEKSDEAAQLEQLNDLVLQRMRTGIIVTDENMNIQLLNQAASTLLGKKIKVGHKLPHIIQDQIRFWEKSPLLHLPPFEFGSNYLQISFSQLSHSGKHDTLVFIEDARELSQQAQQMKLASLGRLTSSIAHEIRNPLGAISHATQLIQESPNLHEDDKHLVDIVYKHCGRMNQIIENILQVSRGRKSEPEKISIAPWLKQLVKEYCDVHSEADIQLFIENEDQIVVFDAGQLRQVVTNLIDNGLRYSAKHTGEKKLKIKVCKDGKRATPILTVTDYGEGIAEDMRDKIFEPFFTTESSGSGLGLYICRELCETNQAALNYQPDDKDFSRFVIRFAHPDKKLKAAV